MLRICKTCHAIQKKTTSGKCNQRGCVGKLEKAWKCSVCDRVQESTVFNKCRERGCKGVLQRLKDEIAHGSAPPRDVMPSSHVYMGTASEARSLVVEKEERKSSESRSSEPIGNIHDRLNLADLDRDSSDWQVLVIRLDDDRQTWYRDLLTKWHTDLEHDPMA
ncbi:hypothetical protein [Paraburkholderia sp. BL10I2N1]|uniref:hypothetical protein n=1 Tax=Paraburkholderia sp. BL10I2N1 TaxID=1938796 RepID=UPI00105C0B78|nr:hypothetical protein [Paraburkholderia sp. BL10I2N1]TDN57849.1 hypothetical protein B0G77_8691 [Paraburkholderia sp. BL10I2N1]